MVAVVELWVTSRVPYVGIGSRKVLEESFVFIADFQGRVFEDGLTSIRSNPLPFLVAVDPFELIGASTSFTTRWVASGFVSPRRLQCSK